VRLVGQDLVTLQWWNEPVHLIDAHLYKVSRWQTRLTLLDSEGRSVPFYYLSLHAETTSTVEVGGETYVLDAQQRTPVQVQTDLRGQLVFSLPAEGLTAPAITISGEGLPASAEIRPDAAVQSYFAGTGKLPFKSNFDGPTLQNATVNGRPLVPSNKWTPTLTPVGAVTAMQSLIAAADPNLPKPKFAGFVFQTYESDRPGLQFFATSEELEVVRAQLQALPEFGGWWEDATDFANDVWEGVKSGAMAVAKAIVDTTGQAVDLVIKIGDQLFALAQLAIETLVDAFNGITALFNMLLNDIKDLIAWLRRVFSFEDFWNTHKAIDQALHRMTPLLSGYVGKVRSFVKDDFFEQLPEKINAAFAGLGDRFDNVVMGELNLNDGEPSFLTRTGQTLLYLNEIADTIIDPAAMWLWDQLLGPWAKVLNDALPSIVLPSLDGLLQPAQRLITALEGVFGQLTSSIFDEFYTWMTSATSRQGVNRGESFSSALFSEFLSVLKNISLAGVSVLETIFDALFDLLEATVQLVDKFLDCAISLPIIDTIWQWFQCQAGVSSTDQSSLTVGGLFSLIVAVPVTVLYKFIYGEEAQPFPGGVLPSADTKIEGADNNAGDACVLAGMTAAILNGILQFGCDGLGFATALFKGVEQVPAVRKVEVLLGVSSIALAFTSSALSWPSKSAIPGSEPDWNTSGGTATFVNWYVGLVQPALDMEFLAMSAWIAKQTNPKAGRVMQFVDPIGLGLDAFLGIASLISGLVESGLAGESDLQWVSNAFQPLSSISLPLRSSLVVRPLVEWINWVAGIKGGFTATALLGAELKWAWMPSKRSSGNVAVAAA
jgi:hypothetical protein